MFKWSHEPIFAAELADFQLPDAKAHSLCFNAEHPPPTHTHTHLSITV